MTCLPWWHSEFADLIATGSKYTLVSGCGTVNGNVQCDPEAMRAKAQAQLRAWKSWSSLAPLPLATYTMARYIAAEVGSGSAEDRVAVALDAVNQAKRRGYRDVNQLLLYLPGAGYGHYGPIHGPEGVTTAPYNRWAATSRDPTVTDIKIADFVLSGKAGNFNLGADDQVGPDAWPTAQAMNYPRNLGSRRDYWVGPIPGVDHWHTFQSIHLPNVAPDSELGKALIARGVAALSNGRQRPDWSGLPVCPAPWSPWIVGAVGTAVSLGVSYALSRGS